MTPWVQIIKRQNTHLTGIILKGGLKYERGDRPYKINLQEQTHKFSPT